MFFTFMFSFYKYNLLTQELKKIAWTLAEQTV